MDDSNQRFVVFENSLTVSLLSLKMTDFTSSTSSAEVALCGHPEQGSSQTPSLLLALKSACHLSTVV